MVKKAYSLVALLIVVSMVRSEEVPTAEQVNENPQKYAGKTLVFDHMQYEGLKGSKANFKFSLKSQKGTTFSPFFGDNQRIVFHTIKKTQDVKSFVETLPKKADFTVRVTCKLDESKEKGRFEARILRFDIVRFDCFQELPGETLDHVSTEEINQDPSKYVGKALVLDGVRLTGVTKNMWFRTGLEVKSAAGKLFGIADQGDQKFIFSIFDKDNEGKAYLENGVNQDYSRPLRITVEMLKMRNGHFGADIKRIDVIAYQKFQEIAIPKPPNNPPIPTGVGNAGITGQWLGKRFNDIQGEIGADWLSVREFNDGTVKGIWWGLTIKEGKRVNGGLITWEAEGSLPDQRYQVRCQTDKDGKTVEIRYTFLYKQNGKEDSYEGQSRLTKQ